MTRFRALRGGWRRGSRAAGTALFLTAGAAAAQTPAELPRVTGSVELTLRNLDVVVTDQEGRTVRGLTAADFEIAHGKRPVTITNFREERPSAPPAGTPPREGAIAQAGAATATPGPEPGPAPAPEPPGIASRPRRHVVLFVDRLALPDPAERKRFFDSLKGLLRRSLRSGDEAMVVTWNRSVRAIQPFTPDLAALERAIDVAAGTAVRLPDEVTEIARLASDEVMYRQMGAGDTGPSIRMDAAREWQDIKGKAAAMRGLIGVMAGMEGRKVLVLASHRFSRQAGAEFGGEGIDTRQLVDSVTDAANAAGVTLYTIYSVAYDAELPSAAGSRYLNPSFGGRPTAGRGQENWSNEMTNLSVLAERTGGLAAGDIAQAAGFVERVAADLDSWYSIGYPAPEGAGRTAAVSVKVRRPGLTVRARRSLVDKSPEEQMKDRVLANLFQFDANARLPIAVLAKTPVAAKKGRVRTPIEIRIPLKSLVLLPAPGGAKGAVSIFVVSLGPGGEFSEAAVFRHDVEVAAADLGSAASSHIACEVEVETSAGESRTSIGVLDEVGKEAGFRVLSRAAPVKAKP